MEGSLSQWLQKRCEEEHLSLREAAAKCDLVHTTLYDIIRNKNEYPRPQTIKKLAQGFGGGDILERHLFTLAGYRSARDGEPVSEALAEVMDKASQLSDSQLKLMVRFAEFLTKIEKPT